MARLVRSDVVMIWDLLIALSLPVWLFVEQVAQSRRRRRRLAIVKARKRTRQETLDALLARTASSRT
ncbi:MAG: hypothetical protein FJZ38_04710 [Candidatus Rokubacteria bacterium]|nr:hypothetical protein [Candidatus Rokubacteria bacterium]